MDHRIEESEECDSGQKDERQRVSRYVPTAAHEIAPFLAAIFASNLLFLYSGRISASLGFHPDVGVVAFWILGLLLMHMRLPVEPPREGLPFLDRWLVFVMIVAGVGAFFCYMVPTERDRWSMSGPIALSGLLIAGLVFLLRGLDRNYPGGLAEICALASYGEPRIKPKEKLGADDHGLD